ncbi:MAG: histidine kinase, partial [Bacillota bacterium]|nr:histidine kinase [Bacillota bacterium]
MEHNEAVNEETFPEDSRKKSFMTSALAGGAFGLVIGIVFLLMGIVDLPPVPFVAGLILLTSGVSGISGLGGAILDDGLKTRGLESAGLRSLVIFIVITAVTFGTAFLFIRHFRWGQISPTLQQYAVPGMFLGLVFGILVAFINYRIWKIQQKLHLLKVENRYLSELAEKDQLLQEAARNILVAEERNSMARELHDSISQGMHGIVFSLHSLRRQLGNDSDAEEILSHLEETTQATLQELRRLIMELTPSPLEDNSLEEALRLHCDLFSRRQQIDTDIQLQYKGKLTPEQEVA